MTIKKITSKGIYYVNQFGKGSFLDFKECNENWLKYRIRQENLKAEQISSLQKEDTIVGQRYVTNESSFIEFFTKPFTKFEFKSPDQMEKFDELVISIFKYGWKTIDWS